MLGLWVVALGGVDVRNADIGLVSWFMVAAALLLRRVSMVVAVERPAGVVRAGVSNAEVPHPAAAASNLPALFGGVG